MLGTIHRQRFQGKTLGPDKHSGSDAAGTVPVARPVNYLVMGHMGVDSVAL